MLKKTYPAGPENTAIPQFEIKIPEISQEKWSNTAIPQTPMSPSFLISRYFSMCQEVIIKSCLRSRVFVDSVIYSLYCLQHG